MKILLLPLGIWFITESFKFTSRYMKARAFSWDLFMQYGGMPSAHSTYVSSLCTIIWIETGIWSISFAIAFVFSGFLVRDAIYLRMIVQRQSVLLNHLRTKLTPPEQSTYPPLNEHVGHTIPEAAVGIGLGFVLTIILNQIF